VLQRSALGDNLRSYSQLVVSLFVLGPKPQNGVPDAYGRDESCSFASFSPPLSPPHSSPLSISFLSSEKNSLVTDCEIFAGTSRVDWLIGEEKNADPDK